MPIPSASKPQRRIHSAAGGHLRLIHRFEKGEQVPTNDFNDGLRRDRQRRSSCAARAGDRVAPRNDGYWVRNRP